MPDIQNPSQPPAVSPTGSGKTKKLLDRFSEVLRNRHYSLRTEKACVGWVHLPCALARKYPNADREFAWQYVFPALELSIDPVSGVRQRHHLNEANLQRAVGQAAKLARMDKTVTPHAFLATALQPISSKTVTTPSTCGLGRCPHRPGAPRSPRR